MLKNPKVTITALPLYFYVPNFGGIVLSSKQLRILQSLCTGIDSAYRLYAARATPYQMSQWSRKFLWLFIKWAWRKVRYLDCEADRDVARACFCNLKKIGALQNPPTRRARRMRHDIYDFIKGGCALP